MTRVLIADDDIVVRDVVRRYLERDGLDVSIAHDGTEALRLLGSQRIDVAVLDVMMPGPDGLTPKETLAIVTREARALVTQQFDLLNDALLPQLAANGIRFLRRGTWNDAQRAWVHDYFTREVLPVLTPIGLDPALLANRPPGPPDEAAVAFVRPMVEKASLALCVNEAWAMLACVAIAGVLLVPFARDRLDKKVR